MAKAAFIGSTFHPRTPKVTNLFSTIRASGGVGCQMVRDSTKNSMEISTSECLKMASSMEREQSGSGMEITTKESMSMDYPRGTGSTCGRMEALSKGTSSRDSAMAMESGRPTSTKTKCTKATMPWTKRLAMVFTIGKVAGATKEISRMTIGMAMASSTTEKRN